MDSDDNDDERNLGQGKCYDDTVMITSHIEPNTRTITNITPTFTNITCAITNITPMISLRERLAEATKVEQGGLPLSQQGITSKGSHL